MKFEYKGQQVDIMPPIKRYMTRIERRLHLPFSIKGKVMQDLVTGVCARHEAGETYEAIMADMGTPRQVADSINLEMADFTWGKSRWRWLFFAIALCSVLWILFVLCCLSSLLITCSFPLDAIGGADGPTAVFVTSSIVPSDWIVPVLLLVVGLLGFYKLSHIRPKNLDKDDQ